MLGLQNLKGGTKALLALTTVSWIGATVGSHISNVPINEYLALKPYQVLNGKLWWTPLTYVLVHQGFWHWFSNMLLLWMFGQPVEQALGTKRYLTIYVAGTLAGASAVILTTLAAADTIPNPNWGVVGASGAVISIITAFYLLFPNTTVYLWFTIPVKARYLAILLITFSILAPMADPTSEISVPAHIGGLIGGWIVMNLFRIRKIKHSPKAQSLPALSQANEIYSHPKSKVPKIRIIKDPVLPTCTSTSSLPTYSNSIYDEALIDRILDKIARQGMEAISAEEKKTLEEHSLRLRQRDGHK